MKNRPTVQSLYVEIKREEVEALRARIAELEGRGLQGGEREAAEVVAVVQTMGFSEHYASWDGRKMRQCKPGDQLMTVSQHERIVAAMEVEIARLVISNEELRDRKNSIAVLQKELAAQKTHQGASVAVPEGWRLVPVEPTEEMLKPWAASIHGAASYRAMLAAAPSPASLNPAAPSPVSGLVEALEKTLGAAHSAITYRGESTSYEYALRQITAAFAALAAYKATGGDV